MIVFFSEFSAGSGRQAAGYCSAGWLLSTVKTASVYLFYTILILILFSHSWSRSIRTPLLRFLKMSMGVVRGLQITFGT